MALNWGKINKTPIQQTTSNKTGLDWSKVTKVTPKSTIPQTTQQDIEYDDANKQVTIRNKPTQQSTRNARRNLQADKNSNVVGQTIKNIGVGSTSTIANMLEHIQDNNAITSHQDYMTALAQSAEELYGDKNPLEMTRKERMAEKRRLENFDLGERQQQIIEERAQQRYEDTDKVTQALRDIRQQEIEDTAQLPKWQQQIANAGFVVGDMVPTVAAGTLGGPLASNTALFMNAKQNAYNQAIENGATHEQAYWNSMLSAGAELGLETLSGGAFNKLAKVPGVANVSKWTQGIKNPIVRGTANLIGDVVGEGTEEVASTLVQPLIDRITYNPQAPLASIQDVWTSFTDSIIPTLMFGGINAGSTAIQKASIRRSAEQVANKQKAEIDKANITENEKTQLKKQVDIVKEQTIQQIESNAEKNVAPQSPQTAETQLTNEVIPPIQQNRNTANMVQNNANTQNMAQNKVENLEKTTYNEVGGVEDGRTKYKLSELVERESQNIESTETILKAQPKILEKNLTKEQKKTKDLAKQKYNKNVIYYDGKNVTAKGLAAKNNNIYIDKQAAEDYGSDFVLEHEMAEDMIFNHTDKTVAEFDKLIEEIQKSKSFTQMYREYSETLTSQQKQDLVFKLDKVAKEVFCDVNGGRNTTQSQDVTQKLKSQLGDELYNKIVSTLDKYEKQIYNKSSEQQGSFLMPTADQLNQPSQEMIEAAQAMTLEEKPNKPKTGFMLVDEGNSYKRNMFNNNAKAINDLIKAKNIATKEIEEKIEKYKALNIRAEEEYKDIIKNLENKKKTTSREINNKILEKKHELRNKKDKTTKVAQTLRGQIANLENRKATIGAEYDARIERLKNIQIKKNATLLKKHNNQIIALEKKKADLEAEYINKIDRLENRNATINKLKKQVSDDRLPTRKEVKQDIITETDMESINLDNAKDLSKFIMNNTTPLRVNEKIFDRETAKRINDTFFRPIKTNEADRIRFLNKERSEIQSLGIEPRSEESEYVQIYGEGEWVNPDTGETTPYTLDNLKKQFPESWEKIKNAAEVIRGKYDTYLDAVNKELNKMGYDSIPKLKNYFRHFEETTSLLDQIGIPSKADHLPTDLNGLTSDLRPGKNFFANALSRTGKKTTYDAITGIDGYLEGVSKLMYHTEDIQKLRTFDEYIRDKYGKNADLEGLNKQEFAEKVEQIQEGHLSEYAAWLSEYTNALAGKKSKMDRGTEEALGRRIYGTLNAVKKQVGSNLTGLNLNSALSNFISITQAGSKTSKYAMLEGFGDTVKNIFQDDGFINKSDFLTRRFGSDKLSKTTWEKMSNAGQIFMAGTDYFSANLITRSKYHEYLNKGYPENEAMRLADEFADRLMGGRALGDMPNIFNSKTLGILTQFQLENVNQFDSMFHDTKYEDRAAEQTKYEAKTLNEKLKSKLAKEKPEFYNSLSATLILGQLFAYAWAYNKVDEELTGSGGAFDPIGIIEDLIKDFTNPNVSKGQAVANLAKNVIDVIPYANILTGGGRVPMTDAIPNIVDLLEGESNLGSELWKVANLALPTGGGQLRKTAQAAGALIQGGDYKTNANGEKQLKFPIAQEGNVAQRIAEGAQALLFGKWATPGGQKYIEDGFRPLSAVQTEGLERAQEMDIGIKEFYDIMESIEELEIPKRKNKEDKEESVPGARKKLIKEELNSRKELTDEQRKLLYDIFYKREL